MKDFKFKNNEMRKRQIIDKSLAMGLMMMLFLFLTKSGDTKSLSLITVSLTYMGGVFMLLLFFLPHGVLFRRLNIMVM